MLAEKQKYTCDLTTEEILSRMTHIPVARERDSIRLKYEEHNNFVLIGETGSGKTIFSGLLALELIEKLGLEGNVACTQPRRLVAESVPTFVSQMTDTEVGGKIGYHVRFNNMTSEETQITYMTDGILLREIEYDPLLLKYAVVIVDEAHEQSTNIVFLLGLLLEANKLRFDEGVDPIRIVVCSATIERNHFAEYIGGPEKENYIEIPGRMFPVEVFYENEIPFDYDFTKAAAQKVKEIMNPVYSDNWEINFINNHPEDYPELHQRIQDLYYDLALTDVKDIESLATQFIAEYLEEKASKEGIDLSVIKGQFHDLVWSYVQDKMSGDILIFMPGKEEINDTIENILSLVDPNLVEVIPLHAELSPADQDIIFAPSEKRKIVVATNIAETGITPPGKIHVIDTGLIKQNFFDPRSGTQRLALIDHALSGIDQRMGRAGRNASGMCIRLFTKESLKSRPKFQTSEILRSDLTPVVLSMKKFGIQDVSSFNFLDQPEKIAFDYGMRNAKSLGALDENGDLTEIGDWMLKLAIKPELGRAFLESLRPDVDCPNEMSILASILDGKNIFLRPRDAVLEIEADKAHAKFFNGRSSDFQVYLDVWKAYVDSGYSGEWAKDNYLNNKALDEARNVRLDIIDILEGYNIHIDPDAEPEYKENALGRALTAGLKGNLMRGNGERVFSKVDKTKGHISVHKNSVLVKDPPKKGEFLLSTEIFINPKGHVYASNCIEAKKEWLKEYMPELFPNKQKTHREHSKKAGKNGHDSRRHKSKLIKNPPIPLNELLLSL